MTPPAAAATARAPARVQRAHAPATPRRPRRISGPARVPAGRRAAPRSDGLVEGVATRAIAIATRAWEHPLLDRALASRAWIGVVTFALLGVVTLQLALLALNGSVGRTLERKAQLLREDSALSIEDSSLASDERVLAQAAQAGMSAVPLGSIRFLDARHASAGGAVAALRSPLATTPSVAQETSTASGSGAQAEGESPGVTSSGTGATAESAGASGSSSGQASGTGEGGSAATGESTSAGSGVSSGPGTPSGSGGEAQTTGAGGGSAAPVGEG
jgi:hypothetical protein